MAYHDWFALPERPFLTYCTIGFAGVFEDGFEQKRHEERSSFQGRGHGLKCETGLYGRSPDRSAIRVCNNNI